MQGTNLDQLLVELSLTLRWYLAYRRAPADLSRPSGPPWVYSRVVFALARVTRPLAVQRPSFQLLISSWNAA
jgi:hypothetical protein